MDVWQALAYSERLPREEVKRPESNPTEREPHGSPRLHRWHDPQGQFPLAGARLHPRNVACHAAAKDRAV